MRGGSKPRVRRDLSDKPWPSAEAAPDGTPGALPAQALDHGTGYLLAAAVLRAVTEQRTTGGTRLARLSLARTAHWLTSDLARDEDGPGAADAYEPGPWLTEAGGPLGRVRYALPPVHVEGAPRDWAKLPARWGTDAPEWS
ncbi:CoA transferase [Streptomyces klenkii]|uniref:CoA transferase n=1 Tax=Streptomyces klenkii TaxID=1420899 RepID=A0A3B0BIL6_9ACTN|nr:hypothetical protein D7231_13325 [Streptomyces klenkii]